MKEVSVSQAVIEWDPPDKNRDQLIGYLVRYKETTTDVYTEMSVSNASTTATLTGLKASSLYQTNVVSIGVGGSSVPGPTAIFLTYTVHGVLPYTTTVTPTTAPPPHDVGG